MRQYILLSALLLALPTIGHAQQKSAVKPGFGFPTDRAFRIVVFRPDVKVGDQSAGGVVTPNAESTLNARDYLAKALTSAKIGGSADVVFMPDVEGDSAVTLSDYRALFNGLSETVLQSRLFKGNRLPTKKTGFEYTLGPDVSKLTASVGGDYGLFIRTDDAYGSAGRKALQIFAALGGVSVTSGRHGGFAGLVDLKTGDLLWFNADYQMGGDVRQIDGATKRVTQLLEGLPQTGAGSKK